jgi:signal transduction histidine kinase
MQAIKKQYKVFLSIIGVLLIFVIGSSYYLIKSQVDMSQIVMLKHANIFTSKIEQAMNDFYVDLTYMINTQEILNYLKQDDTTPESKEKLKIFYEKYNMLISSMKIYDEKYERTYYKTDNNYYILSPRSYKINPKEGLKYTKTILFDNDFMVMILPIKNNKGEITANLELLLNFKQYLLYEMNNYYIEEEAWMIAMDTVNDDDIFIHSNNLIPSAEISMPQHHLISNLLVSKLAGKINLTITYKGKKIYLIAAYSPVKVFDKSYGIIVATPRNRILQPAIISTFIFAVLIFVSISLFITLFRIYHHRIKRAKIETIQSESSFYNLIEILPVGLICLNKERKITLINPQLKSMFGINPDDKVIGLNINDIDNQELNFIVSFNNTPNDPSFQKISIYQDKEKKWFLRYNLSILIGDNQETLIVIIDISEQERAIQLSEEANKARVEFLSNISHEIKTPLTSIKGFSTLLQKKDLDNDSTFFLDNIIKSTDNLLQIFTHIINLAKLEAKQYTLNPLPVNLVQICTDVTLNFKSSEEIRFEVLLPESIPTIFVDLDKLKLILINLLDNAFKFTKEGIVRFELQIMEEMDDFLKAKIRVTDTGIGIPKEKQDMIFKPFVQGDGSFTREHNGIGIGLAISSRLARLLGTEIMLENSDAKGSSFSIRLTLEKYKSAE